MIDSELNIYMAEMVYEYVPGARRIGYKLNFRCPICGDGHKSTSRRGWFYINSGSYYCWNAGCEANESGMSGLMFLSRVSGKSIKEIKLELVKNAEKFVFKKQQPKASDKPLQKSKSAKKEAIDKIDFGIWTKDLPDFCLDYIKTRKLDKAEFKPPWLEFMYNREDQRLVIPWPDGYYQERKLLSSQDKEPKYKFPKGVEKPVFGLDMLDPNFKYIFLLEGVFDSIWVKNGVAVGSLKMSSHQEELIKKFTDDGYKAVWMPDNQFADTSSFEMTKKICSKDPYVEVFIWPKVLKKFKDVNETVMKSDKFIELWKSEEFLKKYTKNSLAALLELT